MKTVGTVELKAQLSKMLARVEAGEQVLITRRGKPVARLVPETKLSPEEAVARMRELSKGCRLNGLKWKELRDEGRP